MKLREERNWIISFLTLIAAIIFTALFSPEQLAVSRHDLIVVLSAWGLAILFLHLTNGINTRLERIEGVLRSIERGLRESQSNDPDHQLPEPSKQEEPTKPKPKGAIGGALIGAGIGYLAAGIPGFILGAIIGAALGDQADKSTRIKPPN